MPLTEREREVLAQTIAGEIDPRYSPYDDPRILEEIASILEVVETRYNRQSPITFGDTRMRDEAGRLGGKVSGYRDRADVALQNKQFSTWNDPDKRGVAKRNLDRFGNVINRAIDGFYNGVIQPVARNITHYHADYVSPKWSRNLKTAGVSGPHIFYTDGKRPAPVAPTPIARPTQAAPLGMIEVADLPPLQQSPAPLTGLPDLPPAMTPLPDQLPPIPEAPPLQLAAGPSAVNAGQSVSGNLGSLAPTLALEPGITAASMGATGGGQFGPLSPVEMPPLEAGPVMANAGATGFAQASPMLTPDARIDQAFDSVPRETPIPMARPIDINNRIDTALSGIPELPGSLAPMPNERPSPMPVSRPPDAPLPNMLAQHSAPGIPVPRSDVTPLPTALQTHQAPLPTARAEAAPMPVARSTAVPGVPMARPEMDQMFASTYDGPTHSGTPLPAQLPTITSPASSIPTIGAQDPVVPTVGQPPSSVPGSLGPQLPGTTTVEKQDRLPSAVEIAKTEQKRRVTGPGVALGIAGGLLAGPLGAVGGFKAGNYLANNGLPGSLGGGFSGFGGTGTGAVEGSIQTGYAAGSPFGGYNSQVARSSFNNTVGASDAQTAAYFDWQDAKARGSYDQYGNYTGQGYGGASGVSQEARDSIDFSGPGLF